MKEKKARVEDALHATRAAVEEGVVPGGGVALVRAVKGIAKLKGANDDQNVGINILRRASRSRCVRSSANAGADASVVLNAVVEPARATTASTLRPASTATWSTRHHRPDQGHASRAAERDFGRRPAADDRGDDRRAAERGKRGRGPWSPRHGRHDVAESATALVSRSPAPCGASRLWRSCTVCR
jgi:hypothetical protein